MIKLRSLTEEGIETFRTWLEHGQGLVPPLDLLNGSLSEVCMDVDLDEQKTFAHRFDFGAYLVERLGERDLNKMMAPSNDGVWAWLSVLYFSQLCKAKKGLGRFQGTEHFIVQRRGLKGSLAYRNAARTSYELVRVHGQAARVCLLRPMNTFGDTAEQLASRAYLARNTALFGAAATLYMRDGAVVKGASSYPTPPRKRQPGDKKGYGGLRRLERHLARLRLTYDTDAMEANHLVPLLPREFDRHRPK